MRGKGEGNSEFLGEKDHVMCHMTVVMSHMTYQAGREVWRGSLDCQSPQPSGVGGRGGVRGRSEGGRGEGGRGTRGSQGGQSRHGREIPGEHRDLPPADLSLLPLLSGSLH